MRTFPPLSFFLISPLDPPMECPLEIKNPSNTVPIRTRTRTQIERTHHRHHPLLYLPAGAGAVGQEVANLATYPRGRVHIDAIDAPAALAAAHASDDEPGRLEVGDIPRGPSGGAQEDLAAELEDPVECAGLLVVVVRRRGGGGRGVDCGGGGGGGGGNGGREPVHTIHDLWENPVLLV